MIMYVAIALAIPIILLPVALIWFINISGILQVIRDRRHKLSKNKGQPLCN